MGNEGLDKLRVTLGMLEPFEAPIDPAIALTSIAISLRDINLSLKNVAMEIQLLKSQSVINTNQITGELGGVKVKMSDLANWAQGMIQAKQKAFEEELKRIRGW